LLRYDDVKVLCDISVPVGIVSNNQHRTIEHIVDLFDLDALVDTYHGRSPTLAGIGYRKPDPTYLQRAIINLGVDQPMYVGDSNVDLIAAERAEIDCAFVRREYRSEYELTREPTYEINSLSEIRPILDCPLQRH
jgi:Predicted phosphatases